MGPAVGNGFRSVSRLKAPRTRLTARADRPSVGLDADGTKGITVSSGGRSRSSSRHGEGGATTPLITSLASSVSVAITFLVHPFGPSESRRLAISGYVCAGKVAGARSGLPVFGRVTCGFATAGVRAILSAGHGTPISRVTSGSQGASSGCGRSDGPSATGGRRGLTEALLIRAVISLAVCVIYQVMDAISVKNRPGLGEICAGGLLASCDSTTTGAEGFSSSGSEGPSIRDFGAPTGFTFGGAANRGTASGSGRPSNADWGSRPSNASAGPATAAANA